MKRRDVLPSVLPRLTFSSFAVVVVITIAVEVGVVMVQ